MHDIGTFFHPPEEANGDFVFSSDVELFFNNGPGVWPCVYVIII